MKTSILSYPILIIALFLFQSTATFAQQSGGAVDDPFADVQTKIGIDETIYDYYDDCGSQTDTCSSKKCSNIRIYTVDGKLHYSEFVGTCERLWPFECSCSLVRPNIP